MSAADPPEAAGDRPVGAGERDGQLAAFLDHPRVLIAVSGGPDSMALLHLAQLWRAGRAEGPELVAATVDHALRPQSAAEAAMVAAFCAARGLGHHTLTWSGEKPRHGIQEAARAARYRLLAEAARAAGATAIALAHTRDDQAETVLFRLARGSGLAGLAAMRPATAREGLVLLRPFLDLPKARLVATLEAAGLPFVRDPSNLDPRFARPRLRALLPSLAAEGLDVRRLARLAERAARADAALEAMVDAAQARLSRAPWPPAGPVRLERAAFHALPAEIGLRLLGRAIAAVGREGPVELGKLEALHARLAADAARGPMASRRTLAGASIATSGCDIVVTPAPPRRERPGLAPISEPIGTVVLGKGRTRT